jgi:hypothetical protein
MENTSEQAIEQLKNLTQSEAWDLIDQIESKFGARPIAHLLEASPTAHLPTAVVLLDGLTVTREDSKEVEITTVRNLLEDAGAKVIIATSSGKRQLISDLTMSSIFIGFDNSENLVPEIDNLLDELSYADTRIQKRQESIDSLKIETKEMLATLHAMVS